MSVEDAAKVLDVHRDSLRRLARTQLYNQGLAVKRCGPDGGVACWWVARAWNPGRLGEGVIETLTGESSSLDSFTQRQRDIASARWRIVQRFRDERRLQTGSPIATWMPVLLRAVRAEIAEPLSQRHGVAFRISQRSIQRWHADCPAIRHLHKLIDKRGGDTRTQGSEGF